jgi:hypothetical protein
MYICTPLPPKEYHSMSLRGNKIGDEKKRERERKKEKEERKKGIVKLKGLMIKNGKNKGKNGGAD